jgi:maltose O-acetyltransferase
MAVVGRGRAHDLCHALAALENTDQCGRQRITAQLFRVGGDTVLLQPPFVCEVGSNIVLGEHVSMNAHCLIRDVCLVTIGAGTLLGPGVQILTADGVHAAPVTIGADVWIGAGAVICPGVTIGEGAVIGAGSVVCRDVPPHVFAAGNPCRLIRRVGEIM